MPRPLLRRTLTSLLVQHNQSPDAGIFALFPKVSQVEREGGEMKRNRGQ